MNGFDNTIMNFVMPFWQRSWSFDRLISFLSWNHLLKGGVLVTILWWLWFKEDDSHANRREHLVVTVFASIVGVALARLLALELPFRLRPIHDIALTHAAPYGAASANLDGWSSFPSDHAVLFFALSTGFLFVSRRAGLMALAYTTLFIAAPRVYLGIHYPTDVIAGALLGIAIAVPSNHYLRNNRYLKAIVGWSYTKPHFFYPLFFLCTYQIVDLFQNSRDIVSAGFKFLKMMIA